MGCVIKLAANVLDALIILKKLPTGFSALWTVLQIPNEQR
jgi:hypothetical protein